MGTRADFYLGRGKDAKWLGSIAWDGYPDGIDRAVIGATSEQEFIENLGRFLESRNDHTSPEMGWPWPWKNSATTDFSYAFDDGKVWCSCFGRAWSDPLSEDEQEGDIKAVFPEFDTKSYAKSGDRSGVILVEG